MEGLQAQVEAQGAKIRSMKEAMKADPTSHTKEQLECELKELNALKVRVLKKKSPSAYFSMFHAH